MRLVQLALKLGVAQHEIISFFQNSGITIPKNGNTKIENEDVKLITAHFRSVAKHPGLAEETAESAPPEAMDKTEEKQEASEANHVSKGAETTSDTDPEAKKAPVEVIRAKKIKLEGIKVLGKIDLPEPVKKAEEQKSAGNETAKKPKPAKREKRKSATAKENNGRKRPSKRKNAETYEQKLKREEREAAKKKRQLQKKIKQQKKKHYEKQLQKIQQPQKPKKKPAKKTSAPVAPQKKKTVRHKNPIRRLWDWLNGRYD